METTDGDYHSRVFVADATGAAFDFNLELSQMQHDDTCMRALQVIKLKLN